MSPEMAAIKIQSVYRGVKSRQESSSDALEKPNTSIKEDGVPTAGAVISENKDATQPTGGVTSTSAHALPTTSNPLEKSNTSIKKDGVPTVVDLISATKDAIETSDSITSASGNSLSTTETVPTTDVVTELTTSNRSSCLSNTANCLGNTTEVFGGICVGSMLISSPFTCTVLGAVITTAIAPNISAAGILPPALIADPICLVSSFLGYGYCNTVSGNGEKCLGFNLMTSYLCSSMIGYAIFPAQASLAEYVIMANAVTMPCSFLLACSNSSE